MRTNLFKKLSTVGEGLQVEYKTCSDKVSESLYETICSFLNHSGGNILVGVNDYGEIIGINKNKIETIKSNIITTIKNQQLFLPCPYFTPQVIEINEKVVLLLEIPCGQYVYRYKGRYWDRNGDADIDITDQPELLLSLFERKNPHLFEERIVKNLTINDLDHSTFQFCRNILAAKKTNHPWIHLSDEDILIHTRLAKIDKNSKELQLKYAALVLFGSEYAIEEYMPRYRFEALFHMCTYEQYRDNKQFPNRYDDRITMRCNLIRVYNQLTSFTERYLPNKFYLPPGSTQREDLRWDLFREIIANFCVHADYSSGYACFYHIFKDRVITKNPTRLLPEIPEGELTLQQLNNYTKNPLLVRVFHELSWVEDMGSGTRNILRYAPLYYQDYKVEINSSAQFLFSITYMNTNLENAIRNEDMSQEMEENVQKNGEMSQETQKNVIRHGEMSQETQKNVIRNEISEEELIVDLTELSKTNLQKRHRRQQGIFNLIKQNPYITIDKMAEYLNVNARTIHRDMEELKNLIEHIGPTKGGYWKIKD